MTSLVGHSQNSQKLHRGLERIRTKEVGRVYYIALDLSLFSSVSYLRLGVGMVNTTVLVELVHDNQGTI